MGKKCLIEKLSGNLMCIIIVFGLIILNSFAEADPISWDKWPLKVNIQLDIENNNELNYYDKVLTEIEKYKGLATIFVTGEFASKYPEIIKTIEARGHQIAVYGWQKGEDISKLKAEKLTETKKEELKKKVRLKTIEGENDCWGKFYETK